MDGIDTPDGVIDEPRFFYSDNIPSKRGTPAINQLKNKDQLKTTYNYLSEGSPVYYRISFGALNGDRKFFSPRVYERIGRLGELRFLFKNFRSGK